MVIAVVRVVLRLSRQRALATKRRCFGFEFELPKNTFIVELFVGLWARFGHFLSRIVTLIFSLRCLKRACSSALLFEVDASYFNGVARAGHLHW